VATSAQPNHPFGEYAAKKLGYKRIAMIADDFAFGHEVVAGFQRTFEESGGHVVQKLWPPSNAPDYGTYIAQLPQDVDPRGPLKLDDYGNPVQDILIRRVERQDGRLINRVIDSYPAVSQFWRYEPSKFLSQPVYSREFSTKKSSVKYPEVFDRQ
jgi:hypothetical protein